MIGMISNPRSVRVHDRQPRKLAATIPSTLILLASILHQPSIPCDPIFSCTCTQLSIQHPPNEAESHNMVRRLRTLSGCLTCRRRRKKCDEARPQCTLCLRLGLRCTWESNDGNRARHGHRINAKTVEDTQHVCMLLNHQHQIPVQFQHFQLGLTAQCSAWIASTLSPLALAQWRSAETLMTEIQGCKVGREAIDAFAATIATHGGRSDQANELELKNQALAGVRSGVLQFAHGHLQNRSLPALIISVFLLAFTEVSGLTFAFRTTDFHMLIRGLSVIRQRRLRYCV